MQFDAMQVVNLLKVGAEFIGGVIKRAKSPAQAIGYIRDRTRELDNWESDLDDKIDADFPSEEEQNG